MIEARTTTTRAGGGLNDDTEGLFSRDFQDRLVRMDAAAAADFDREVTVTVDGTLVTVRKAVPATDAQGNYLRDADGLVIPRATTIYDAATQLYGGAPGANPIPILCHRDHMTPAGVCRICVVQISKVKRGRRQAERKLLPACQHRVEDTMEIQTVASPNDPEAGRRVRSAVKVLLELLISDHQTPCARERETGDCELEGLARRFGVGEPRFPRRAEGRGRDDSSLVIAVDHDACILCDRCVRGCNDVRNNQVIGRTRKGGETRIAFDLDQPMGRSSCVACGECVVSCPTGALSHRTIVEADAWGGGGPAPTAVTARELFGHPLPEIRRAFGGVAPAFLRWNSRAVVRKHFKKGEVICREGAYGSTAFLIEEGSVEVSVATRPEAGDAGPLGGLLRSLAARFLGRGADGRDAGRPGRRHHNGTSAAMGADASHDVMGPGSLFGEMTCMNHYPRSATVRAAEDCTVLELLRNVLYIMQRSPSFRAELERNYRARAINNHLRHSLFFAPLRRDEARFGALIDELKAMVQLRRCDPGEIIFRQGEPAHDGFYVVRSGFVKVSQARPGGELVLNYVGPGGHFGEIGLLAHLPELSGMAMPGLRTATCAALDHVDLVRIPAPFFREILERFPDELRNPLIAGARSLLASDRSPRAAARSDRLVSFLDQGLMNAQSLLVLDLEKCTRCDECTRACAQSHGGVTRLIRDGLRFDRYLVASSCRSCLDPYCLVGCPVGAIRRRDGVQIVIEDWCIGCGKCAENCPYGNINMHAIPTSETAPDPGDPSRRLTVVRQEATTCDLCRGGGRDAEPNCVYACPHDAAHRMSGAALFALVEQATRF
jgi:CRP-like cAMP-binding protein/Fe-S-cluster-containing dehydrogenase component